MKRVTIEKVVKAFMVGIGLMFAYGIITFIVLIAKHGLHIRYISDESIEFVLAMLGITLFVGYLVFSPDTKDKNNDECDDEETLSYRLIHDPTYSTFSCNIYHLDD